MEAIHELYCDVGFLLSLHFLQTEERKLIKKSAQSRVELFKVNGYHAKETIAIPSLSNLSGSVSTEETVLTMYDTL